jgi:hypothetical protein
VPSTAPAVITGDAMRTRSRARPIAWPMRCESSSPCPGVNQARTSWPSSSSRSGGWCPLASTLREAHSSSKFWLNSAASSRASSTTTITFS